MRARLIGLCLGVALSLLALSCAHRPPAVEWTRTFAGRGGAEGHCVQQTSDGGYVAAGMTASSSGGPEFYLVKVDSSGHTEWERDFGNAGAIGAYSVQQTADGGYVMVGSGMPAARDSFQLGVWLTKITSLGDIEWQKLVSDSAGRFDLGFSVVQSGDGGFAVAAVANLSADSGLALTKTDSLGDVTWTRLYPVSYPNYAPSNPVQLRQTSDGGYIIATKTLLKVDSLGNQQWLSTFSGTTGAYSVVQTYDGGYAATGPALFLLRTDAQGDLQLLKEYAHSGYSRGNWVEQTADGGYVIAGEARDAARIIRTDSSGSEIWHYTRQWDGAQCVRQTRDGGYVATGYHDDMRTNVQSLFMLKLAPDDKRVELRRVVQRPQRASRLR